VDQLVERRMNTGRTPVERGLSIESVLKADKDPSFHSIDG
jgi:hypothetical protein